MPQKKNTVEEVECIGQRGAFPILNGPAMGGWCGGSSLRRRYLEDVRDEEYLEKDNLR